MNSVDLYIFWVPDICEHRSIEYWNKLKFLQCGCVEKSKS